MLGGGLNAGSSGMGLSSGSSGMGLGSGSVGSSGFGSDSSFGGGFTGGNYGLGSGTTQGLSVGYDSSPGYGFNTGTDYGLTAGPGFGGSLGYGLNDPSLGLGAGFGGYGDYGFGGMNYGGYAQDALGTMGLGQGLQATASPGWAPTLGQSSTTNAFSQQDDPGFYGSKAHKVMNFLAQFNPVTRAASGLYGVLGAPDPAKAGLNAALGMVPGPLGMVGRAAYGASQSSDPGGYLGTQAAGTLGGMVGGALGGAVGGPMGAQAGGMLGSEALGGLAASEAGRAAAARGDTGPYGSASPADAGRAQAQANMGRTAAQSTGGGGERDWIDTALKVGSGLYGMYQGNKQQQMAQQAIAGSAPWTAQGGNAMAGQELQRVIRGDLANDPGFKLAQLSAARAGSQQPGGFAASAAANAALKYQMERMQALGAPAGVGFNPAQGYQTALAGQQQGINTQMAGLAEIGAGTTGTNSGVGMNTMPPWLQQYLITNNLQRS